jgi:amino acid adenylation domain-containing protein
MKNKVVDFPIQTIQGFRLSPQQKRVWLWQQLEKDSPYQTKGAFLIEASLNLEKLQQAWQQVVNRHEILRTVFSYPSGLTVPLQVISDRGNFSWKNIDLSNTHFENQNIYLEKLFQEIDNTSCLYLVTLSEKKQILLISLPALYADAKSLKNLVTEISHYYSDPPINSDWNDELMQYADFAEWQNEILEADDTEAGRKYWQTQDFSQGLKIKLPLEKSFTESSQFQPQFIEQVIDCDKLAKILILAKEYQVSLSSFILACWQVLIYRITKESTLIIGTAFDGRKYTELESAIGLIAKYLPIQNYVEANISFIEILKTIEKLQQEVYQWQEYFSWKSNSLSELFFFPICFEFERLHQKAALVNRSFSIIRQYSCIDRFKLKLVCHQKHDTLTTEFHYDASLFSQSDIQRLARQFNTLVTSIIETPNLAIAEFNILSETEQQQILVEFNHTKTDFPFFETIYQKFEQKVEKNPNAIAIVYENEQLTYQQLNQRANQLAHYLQRMGIAPEDLVAIYLERSLEMSIGLLGVLKAGGAYVPLDCNLPPERLTYMLRDTQAKVILTQQQLVNNLSQSTATISCLDTDWHIIQKESDRNLEHIAKPENLAYVIYTSGSTGMPKGVAIEHRQILNYLNSISEKLNLANSANFAMVSTFAADLGNTVLFPALSTGGCLHLISKDRVTNADALGKYFQQHPIDYLKIAPSHLLALLASEQPELILPRQKLILGGEALSWSLVEKIQQLTPSCRILNHYGPTETTVGVLTYEVEGKHSSLPQTVPIGRPLANTQIYILDDRLEPVPIGVQGEIYIGGEQVARGYLNQPQLTAQKFIANRFDKSKLYKTGDLARYLPDGNIEFLGRIDRQVKIRGFRIELPEIETVLEQHHAIKQAIAILRKDMAGDERLVSYLVIDPSLQTPTPNSTDLHNFLKAKLPEQAIPSAFVFLKNLPLTANGKIDREKLPAPEQIRPELSETFVPPRDRTEEIIAGIWAEILAVEQVGIHDDFFELGGHSLLATQVVSRISKNLQVEISLRQFFDAPTIADLALAIAQTSTKNALTQIQRQSRDSHFPLSFAQQRLWFLAQLEPNNPFYNQPSALRLTGRLQIAILKQSLQEIIGRHETLRTNFILVDGQPVQLINKVIDLTMPVVNLEALAPSTQEQEIENLAIQEAQRTFNLEQDLLLRVTLLRLSLEEHIVLFTTHHIVSDGWSTGILVQEIATLYEAFASGNSSPLPELPIQYADFAVWQRQWLTADVLEGQLNYWQKQLSNSLPLNLPTDRPRPIIPTYQGNTQTFVLSESLTKALKTLSQQEGVTLFMTLLAAFKVLLYRYSHQDDLVVGTPIANRNRAEIERLIGFFVNTLVLRTNLSGNPSFRELLQRVREGTLEAYTHQDLPFEQLVETLQIERHLNRNPLFDVMFALQNAPEEKLELPGLTLSSLSEESQTAIFDLTLSINETEQGLEGSMEYSTDLFDTATIERMLGHFQVILEAIAAAPEQRLSDLPLLTPTEQQQLLIEWNHTQTDYPKNLCIHHLFEAQVEKTPDAVAVVFEDQQLTYRELNNRANQLAHYLQQLGVKAEVKVSIYLERSLEMSVAILGVLKAGGTYIPIDPNYPRERVAIILEDAQVKLILSQSHLEIELSSSQSKWINLDRSSHLITQQSTKHCLNAIDSQNLAYVIYTSGSTGKPKGVAVSHTALVNYTLEIAKQFQIEATDRMLQFASVGFDVVIEELFPTWIRGATVVLSSNTDVLSYREFQQLIEKEQLTVFELPTAYWHQWVLDRFETQGDIPSCVRLVIVGGERISSERLKQWQKFSTPLVHVYGLTETTVTSTLYPLPSNTETLKVKELPIGKAIANTQIYLLDSKLQPVPVGVPGELYIGGIGLARGYLNRAEMTAQRFVPHPFSQQPGARLYRTGDLARYLPDGNIEYIDRIDYQVKLRGFRIELGEIESVLLQLPEIRDCVVIDREDTPGQKRLVAYLVTESQQLAIAQLQTFLKQQLPNYMIPSAFVQLEAFPLTPNGKVNRRALPIPDPTQFELEETFVAPRSPLEEAIAEIWCQVLNIERVGIHNNFFDLGGHSLIATQVVSRLRDTFQVELPVRSIFESPTIAELAVAVVQNQIEQMDSEEKNQFLAQLKELSEEEPVKSKQS